jgi:hypothetical protein
MNMQQQVPNTRQLRSYDVFREGWETIRQSLYHYQAYAAAGQSQLTFFQVPAGSNATTNSDTNMQLAGQIPANQQFLIQSIEVVFLPTVPSVAAQLPGAFGAGAVPQIVNDAYIVGRAGNLTLTIGQKPYLQEAPLGRFAPKANFDVSGAASDATTAAANLQLRLAYGKWVGRPYLLDPAAIRLPENANFSVTLNWPEGVQALPSGNPGRIGVILDGFLYRRSQ